MYRSRLVIFSIAYTLGSILALVSASAEVPKDHIDRVLLVFIAEGCVIDAAKDGERLERELGLDTVEFSLAVDSLMKQGLVSLDPDTLEFRLRHESCG